MPGEIVLPEALWSDDSIPAPQLGDVLTQLAHFFDQLGYTKTFTALCKEATKAGVSVDIIEWENKIESQSAATLLSLYEQWYRTRGGFPTLASAEDTGEVTSDSSSESESEDDDDDDDDASGLASAESVLVDVEAEETSDDDSDEQTASEVTGDSDSDSDSSDASSAANAAKAGAKRKRVATPPSSSDESSKSDESGSDPDSDSDSSEDSDAHPAKRAKLTKITSSSASSSASSDSDDDSASDSDSSSDSESASSASTSSSDSEEESETSRRPAVGKSTKKKDKIPRPVNVVQDAEVNSTKDNGSQSSATLEADSSIEKDQESEERNHIHPDRLKHLPATKRELASEQKQKQVPFSRIPSDQRVDPRFASNDYVAYDYADRAYRDLSVTKGKGFTKEKNKKKRGAYRGGAIDLTPKGIKFDD